MKNNYNNYSSNSINTWNGGICTVCNTKWIDYHECDAKDLIDTAKRLLDRAEEILQKDNFKRDNWSDARQSCPCRPENGGSGICGCILGGFRVTC